MNQTYVTTATLTGRQTILLDDALPLPVTGRVRVTIEIGQLPEVHLASSFLLKLQAIHQALAQSGYQPRTAEAINAQIRDERTDWDECRLVTN
jgi:hypothetical protein